jgi:RTX calcium-binding nonapeptide repeat (4 copies)
VGRLSKVVVFVVVLMVAAASVAVAANRIGTNEANTLTGTADPDFIVGLGGADTLNGLDNRDELSGSNGTDTMNGGEGDDTMVGGPGVDNMNSGNSANAPGGSQLDFVHSVDGVAETVCFGTGDFYFVADASSTLTDTIKRDTIAPTDCTAATGTTTIWPTTPATLLPAGATVVEGGHINNAAITPSPH